MNIYCVPLMCWSLCESFEHILVNKTDRVSDSESFQTDLSFLLWTRGMMIIPISLGCCRELTGMMGMVVLCCVLGPGHLKLYFLRLLLQASSHCISTSFPLLVEGKFPSLSLSLPAFYALNSWRPNWKCFLSRTSLLTMKFYSFTEGFKNIHWTLF